MSNKELLKQKLEDAKKNLEEQGYFLGGDEELMFQFPAMKQYEYAFQAAIEDVWPEDAWWERTNYWDIFQDSIMSGKPADEVIQDILDHIVEEEAESFDPEVEESLEEECKDCKVSESVFELVKDLDEGE